MKKLDMGRVKEEACTTTYTPGAIRAHQVAVYVMCGGGMLGHLAAEQPADFAIDDRVGRLPYPKREIEQAVAVLVVLAENAELDPHKMPLLERWHNCGIW